MTSQSAYIGKTNDISNDVKDACYNFVCLWEGYKIMKSIAMWKIGEKCNCQNITTQNSFNLNVREGAYLLIVWEQATQAMQNLPELENYGFMKMDETLTPRMMMQDISAPELLNISICECRNYCTEDYSCVTNNQPYSPACSCGPEEDIDEQLCMNTFIISILSKSDDRKM